MSFEDGDTVVIDGAEPQASDVRWGVGRKVGRYVLVDHLGSGGMGEVYCAFDPKLGREVALKRLSAQAATKDARARLMREAHAMASLSHPNIVPVFDVENAGDDTYITMEYVRGETLAQWIESRPPWPEVVGRFRQAALGLAAAHAEGILHRDFKPANAIIGRDGRVRVMDFGLARRFTARTSERSDAEEDSRADDEADDADDRLTRQDTMVGTPAYMPPEQFHAPEIDERADVFAFSVSLWEALYGERPHSARAWKALVKAKLAGPPAPPRGRTVPRWLHDVVARGLAARPEERWPSMHEVAAALARDSGRRRLWVGVALTAVASSSVFAWTLRAPTPTSPCQGSADKVSETWDAARRDRIREALEGTAVPYAAATAERVLPMIDRYAQRWADDHRDACEATSVRGEQSDEALDLRMACLDRARAKLAITAKVLEDADAGVAQNAHGLVASLPPLDRCADLELLRADVQPPREDVADEVESIRMEASEVWTRHHVGRREGALQQMQGLLERAVATNYAPIVSDVEVSVGELLREEGRLEEAEATLTLAFERALATPGDIVSAARSAKALSGVVGSRRPASNETRWLAMTAVGVARHLPEHSTVLSDALAALGGSLDDPLEGEPYLREAWAVMEARTEDGDPRRVAPLVNLALGIAGTGKEEEALELYGLAATIVEDAYGPSHPKMVAVLSNHAGLLRSMDRAQESIGLLQRALEIAERTLGESHRNTIVTVAMLSQSQDSAGETEAAIGTLRRATELTRKHYGDRDPMLPHMAHNLGFLLNNVGDLENAVAAYRESIGLRIALDESDPNTAAAVSNLGNLLLKMGRHEDALAEFQRALELPRGPWMRDHSFQRQMGEALLAMGRIPEACEQFELSYAGWHEDPLAKDSTKGRSTLGLARCRKAQGKLPEAAELAQAAVALLDAGHDESGLEDARAEFPGLAEAAPE